MGRYLNSTYWKDLHASNQGKLGRVGHPDLSESLNRLKYESEGESFSWALSEIRSRHKFLGHVKVLDVGAGTGYWSGAVYKWCASEGMRAEITALDLSEEALRGIREKYPWIKTHREDLVKVEPGMFSESFDIVISAYCLHHLISLQDFCNALQFACRSVKKNGFLIIMDPVLTKPFSTFDVINFGHYKGNGIVRHLYLLDDVASREGLKRSSCHPAVSFLLNGNIEASGRVGFGLCRAIWTLLRKMYVKENWTERSARILRSLDRRLKAANLGFSSSVVVYLKNGTSDW